MKIVQPIQKLSAANLKSFTDRQKERDVFRRLLDQGSRATDEFFVLSCYGIAGSGKSRLLQEYKAILEEAGEKRYVYASYDFENNAANSYQVITRLYRQLEKNGLAFPLTAAAELAYQEKSGIPVFQQVQEQDVLDHPVFSILGSFVPAVNQALSIMHIGKEALHLLQKYKEKLSALWDTEKKELDQELARIWQETDAEKLRQFLPEYFRLDLSRNTRNLKKLGISYPLVIFLDTFESCVNLYDTTGFAPSEDAWLRNDIINRVPGILWVISGREPLGWKESNTSYADMEECSLEEFSEADAEEYLRKAQIPAHLWKHMLDITNRLPLLLDVCVDSYYEQAQSREMIHEEDIGVNSQDLIGRFVRCMGKTDQQIAVVLALLDHWSQEDARSVFPKVLGEGFSMGDYDAFLQHTIIRKDREERFYIHQSVRDVILAYAKEPRFSDIVDKVRRLQAEKYTLPATAGLGEILAAKKDLDDLRKQGAGGQEYLEEADRKNREFYERINRIKGGGWGPERPMYTMKKPSPSPVFNSIRDNNVAGDERSFVRIATKGARETYTYLKKLHPFETYQVYIGFDNACTSKENGAIEAARARVFLPSGIDRWEIGKVSARLSAGNTVVPEVWSIAYVWCDTPLSLTYVKGSAHLYGHNGKSIPLPARLFRKEGQLIGTEKLDGVVPADGSGHIILDFIALPKDAFGPERPLYRKGEFAPSVTFNSRIDHPVWSDERQFVGIRKVGEKEYRQEISLSDNTEYEVRVFYHNNADPELNRTGKGIANHLRASVVLPEAEVTPSQDQRIIVCLHSLQAGDIWASVRLKSGELPLGIQFVNASAVLSNRGRTNGTMLSTDLFQTGQYLGVNVLDGRLPAGEDYSGYITFRIRTSCLKCRVQRTASLDGENFAARSLEVRPGDVVTFRTEFVNTGTRDIRNVVFKDVLPKELIYMEGSTVLRNSSNPEGLVMKDVIHRNGFNTGLYGPGANAIVTYRVLIPEEARGEYVTSSYLYHNEGALRNDVTLVVN